MWLLSEAGAQPTDNKTEVPSRVQIQTHETCPHVSLSCEECIEGQGREVSERGENLLMEISFMYNSKTITIFINHLTP